MMRYPALVRYAFFTMSIAVFGATVPYAAPVRVADNLLIEGYYTQEGQKISHGQVVKFLLNQPYEVANYADKSKGYGLASFAVGGPMWLATTGFSIWQATKFADFIEKADFNDPNTLIYPEIWKFAVPLMVGTEITLFIQNRLRNRSKYMLHKAVKAYDSILCTKHQVNIILDHQIKEMKPGWFMQDRVLMPTSILYSVLKDNSASRGAANSSIACRAIAFTGGLVAGYCVTSSVIGLIEAGPGEKKINKGVVYSQLGIGIGSLLIATVTSVMSAGIRDKAITKYNESLPKAPKPLQLFDPIPTEPVNYPPR
jgi:hypothetical protein